MKTFRDSSGVRYGYRIINGLRRTDGGHQCYYAEIVKSAPKTYGKNTAFGARTVLKPFAYIKVGEQFPEKADAVKACKDWLEERFNKTEAVQ